jgi:hypothetical protein
MRERVEKVKQHFKDHHEAYISSAVTAVVVGIAGSYYLRPAQNQASQRVNAGIAIKPVQVVNQIAITVKRKGTLSNIIEHIETGDIYRSQNDAAKELGLDAGAISKHLHGRAPHVKGNHFRIAEVPT